MVDHNPELLARVTSEIPNVVVIPNGGKQGVSGGRNSGARASHGELVAFLDDDVVAPADWLSGLVAHLQDPDVVGAGTYFEGNWESPRPRWFPGEFGWTLGLSYAGMPTEPTAVRNVWTSAMVVRKSPSRQSTAFGRTSGRSATAISPRTPTSACGSRPRRTKQGTWIYDPLRISLHQVPAGRATFRYFLSRCFLQGWGKAAMARMDGFGTSTSMEMDYTRRILPARRAPRPGRDAPRRRLRGAAQRLDRPRADVHGRRLFLVRADRPWRPRQARLAAPACTGHARSGPGGALSRAREWHETAHSRMTVRTGRFAVFTGSIAVRVS